MRSKPSHHQRFYLEPGSIEEGAVRFSRKESRHMLSSLRLGKRDVTSATDGAGSVYSIVIDDTARGIVSGRIQSVRRVPARRPAIWLFQGVIKPARMDAVVEGSVELGIAGLVPVVCERSRESVSAERLERWKRLAVEAMKQSLQCHLAQIRAPEAFGGALRLLGSGDLVLVASEQEAGRLDAGEAASVPHRVAVWVGPEGGFADREMECLAQGGGRCFSLGPTRLRSETAAVAAVALVTQRFCWP